jgi:hypothetical protein
LKVKIISAYNKNFKEVSDLSFATIEAFCEKSFFDCERFFIDDIKKTAAWSKIKILLENIDPKHYDYILWIDADAIILNQDFYLKDMIDTTKILHISRDFNNINSGVMLWKSCELSRLILEKVWSLREKYHHHKWWEQAAIIELFEMNFKNIMQNTKMVKQSIFNAYEMSYYPTSSVIGQINEKSFICHFPSLGMKTRIELIKKYTKQ